jgi:hypothetical protein
LPALPLPSEKAKSETDEPTANGDAVLADCLGPANEQLSEELS